jgi:hypothetical protein
MTRMEKIGAALAITIALLAGLGPAIAANVEMPEMGLEVAGEPMPGGDVAHEDHAGHDHGDVAHADDTQAPEGARGTGPSPGPPPSYLRGKAFTPQATGPAHLLYDGRWCGNREPVWRVFDVYNGSDRAFQVRLPEDGTLPYVELSGSRGSFAAYDARRHPSSEWSIGDSADQAPELAEPSQCERCQHDRFHVAVGTEIPADSEGPDDISWFALSVRCAQCRWESLIYGDSTS